MQTEGAERRSPGRLSVGREEEEEEDEQRAGQRSRCWSLKQLDNQG